jgi:O-antigen ligase/tetratricopeptide (TPR) repeat protein
MRAAHGIAGAWPGTADAFLTLRVFVQFSAYVLAALLVLKLRDAGVSGTTMIRGVCAVLVVQALYAIVQQVAGLKEIPFYGPRAGMDSASGTFVNRNTFAGVMAMGIVAAVALRRGRIPVMALFAVALILSRSRGGAAGAALGLVLVPLLLRGRGSLAAAGAIVLAGGAGMLFADPTVLLGRFGELDPQDIGSNERWKIWTSTLGAALHQPLLGFGVGTHPHAYHPYQPTLIAGQVHHAHNEYVNFFFEGGVAWLLILVAGFGAWAARTWTAAQRLPGPERLVPIVALAAAFGEAAHSVVDFDLRATSAGLLFAVLIGLGGAVRRSPTRRPLWAGLALAGLAALALLLAPLDSEPRVDEAARSEPERAATLARGALALSPYNFRAAWVLARATDEDARYKTAADLWPAHPGLQKDVGLHFWELGDGPAAAHCLRRLFEQRPSEVDGVLRAIWRKDRPVADYQALLPETPAAAGAFAGFLAGKGKWREAMELFEKGCPAEPAYAGVYDAFAARLEAEAQWGMAAAILDRRLQVKSDPAAHAASARAWSRLGAHDRAQDQVVLARRTDPSNVAWIALAADLQRAAGKPELALEACMEAVRRSPRDPALLLQRASLYEEMKLYPSAADDYRHVLRLRPGDAAAVAGLARSLQPH